MLIDDKGRPLFEHWLGIAKRAAAEQGVTIDTEQAWLLRRVLFEAHAEGYREGLRDARNMPGSP